MVFLKSVRFSRKQEEKRSFSVMQGRAGILFLSCFLSNTEKIYPMCRLPVFHVFLTGYHVALVQVSHRIPWFFQYFLIERESFFLDGTDYERMEEKQGV